MKIQEKLQLILKISRLTQQELAGRLGVTFAALNRWINAKAVPRPKAQEKIDDLHKNIGELTMERDWLKKNCRFCRNRRQEEAL